MTRKTREKKKIQKIEKTVYSYILKKFVLFSSRSTYTFQVFTSFYRIINYRK